MLDEMRIHDATPTPEEQAWVAVDALGLIMKAAALAGIAVALGVSASLLVDPPNSAPTVASHATP